jgi:hypothetical protein
MGALADFQAVKQSVEKGRAYPFTKNSITTAANRPMSYWTATPNAATAPGAAAACNANTTGALLQEPKLTSLTNSFFLTQAEISIATTAFTSLMLVDRLSHQSGLSGTSTATQTTNLPTAALTRYTSGEGVMAALEIYTAIGSTASTVTISYTNQAGVSGRTSKPAVIGGASDNTASRFIIIPLQDDDTGIRSVESVTLSATTATAGNFGVTLFKPLMILPNFSFVAEQVQPRTLNTLIGGCGCCPEIMDDACLQLLGLSNSTVVGVVTGAFYLAEA